MRSIQHAACLVGAMAIACVTATRVEAATSIAKETLPEFKLGIPQTATVQASAWFKSAFGNAGWTHFSKWGYIRLKAGQKITATVQSNVSGLHPGLTCWQRAAGKKYAPLTHFTGHSYLQFSDVIAKGSTDEDTGAKVGNFKMKLVANGYDRDGMTQTSTVPKNSALNPLEDGIAGSLSLSFRAKTSGVYMCVTGGINPDITSTASGGFDNNMTRHAVTWTFTR